MALDERTSRPLYRQVADELRKQIHHRELEPGGQLPTEATLMGRYGVSRNTIRLALDVLRTEGLVVTGQGRGSFVADVEVRRPSRSAPALAPRVISRSGDALDRELTDPADGSRVVVNVATRPAPPLIADRLGLQAGDRVIVRHRLRLDDNGPSHSSDCFMAEGLTADSALVRPGPLRASLTQLLHDAGHPMAWLTDEVGVRMPTPAEAQELQIATGVPLLNVQRTVFADDDQALLTITALLPGDRHVLRYDAAARTIDDDVERGHE